MKNKKFSLESLLFNNKVVFLISFLSAILVWVLVVINASSEITRVIPGVKVIIDTTVPSQFGLEVFGNNEYTVDVTVKGKKYLISSAALSAEDISVVAQTSNVDSAGVRTLALKAESASGTSNYKISSLSVKTVDVYFDVLKTVDMVIEPKVVAKGFPVVKDGFTTGDIKLSKTSVTVSGPSTEVNNIEKVVAQITLEDSLSANKTADAKIIPLDKKGRNSFDYVTLSLDKVNLAIPVLQTKSLAATVTFKNAPDTFVLTPLKYSVSPSDDLFDISVDEYEKTKEFSVGVIDFKLLSPSNHVFEFDTENASLSKESDTDKFYVDVDLSGYSQDYFQVETSKIKLTNTTNQKYTVYGLNKSVVIVGKQKDLESVTADDIEVVADLSAVEIRPGQTQTVPVQVSVNSTSCWVYGIYYADVALG